MTDRSIPVAPTTSTPLQDQLRDFKINKPLRGGSRLNQPQAVLSEMNSTALSYLT